MPSTLPRANTQKRPWMTGENLVVMEMSCTLTASVSISWLPFCPIVHKILPSVQFSSATQSCQTLCDPMDCSTPGFPVHHQLPELAQTHIHPTGDAIHLILCCPLLLLSSIFPSIRVVSSELVLCIGWPKYWSFSFSISPSNEYSGLIS